MPSRMSFLARVGSTVAVTALVAVPAAAASREQLLSVISSPYLLGAARIGAQYGTVTSGYRSLEHNRAVGGMPRSYHLQGRALDVQRRAGVTHAMIDAALRRAGYNLIESLDEIDHSHFAFGDAAATGYARPVTIAGARPVAPPPAKPAEPALLADVHGWLVIDDRKGQANGGVAGVP